jgi:diphthine-ammonia ligase
LENAIIEAKKKFGIQGIVTGAVESVYQASRVQKICNKLGLECFNPLWQKNQIELLNELIKNRFEVIISGVFAYPLDKKWLGRKIDKKFIEDVKILNDKYGISPGGEGGEFESFVVNCPMFSKGLKIINKNIEGENNSWKMEVEVE